MAITNTTLDPHLLQMCRDLSASTRAITNSFDALIDGLEGRLGSPALAAPSAGGAGGVRSPQWKGGSKRHRARGGRTAAQTPATR